MVVPSPRDRSPCWVGVLYALAWDQETPLLSAPIRERSTLDEDGSFVGSYYCAALKNDVFTSSAAAIDLLLQINIGAATSVRSEVTNDLVENSLQLDGEVWHFRYQAETGDYPKQRNQCIGWLAKLLAAPNRPLSVAGLRGDPEGRLAADGFLGNEQETDREGIKVIKDRLEEIEDIAGETGWSESLENEKAELLARLKEAENGKRMIFPLKTAHHNIASQIRKFLRKTLAKPMPKLKSHLAEALKLEFPDFGYYPPPDTPAWKI
jgi:hypothetical protein